MGRDEIISDLSLTTRQILDSVLAIPAFLPATVSTGYLAAFATNLQNFRRRTLAERLFWSVPLSLALSTISAVLIGKFISLFAFVVVLWATTIICLAIFTREQLQLRRVAEKRNVGWKPRGGAYWLSAPDWMVLMVR